MTPATLLVVFCAAMAVLALWRLGSDDATDRVEVGTTIIVVGLTLLSGAWAATGTSALTTPLRSGLALVGLVVAGLGVATVVRYWSDPAGTNATEQ